MLYTSKIANYLEILSDEENKDFLAIKLEYLKSAREALHSKLGKKRNLKKVAEWFYTFSTIPDEVKRMLS